MSEDLFLGRILSEEKYVRAGLISEKIEILRAELTKRAETATSSYSAAGHFLQYIILCLWLRIARSSDQGI